MDSGFQLPIPVFASGTWILDSNRQWAGFRIPWSVFRIQKPRIPESGFTYMGRVDSVRHCYLNLFITNRLKMPPKKRHKTLEGQTRIRFANKRPSRSEEKNTEDENLQYEWKTIGQGWVCKNNRKKSENYRRFGWKVILVAALWVRRKFHALQRLYTS